MCEDAARQPVFQYRHSSCHYSQFSPCLVLVRQVDGPNSCRRDAQYVFMVPRRVANREQKRKNAPSSVEQEGDVRHGMYCTTTSMAESAALHCTQSSQVAARPS